MVKKKQREQILTELEISKFDLYNEKEKNRQAELKEEVSKKEIVSLQRQVLLAKVDLLNAKELLLKVQLDQLKLKHENSRKEFQLFRKTLTEELKLKSDKWGFNPITGEIIE